MANAFGDSLPTKDSTAMDDLFSTAVVYPKITKIDNKPSDWELLFDAINADYLFDSKYYVAKIFKEFEYDGAKYQLDFYDDFRQPFKNFRRKLITGGSPDGKSTLWMMPVYKLEESATIPGEFVRIKNIDGTDK